uniref:Uncharacterized protein n=1 Tax=Oryza glaberrima TaxID=4538 RepID=I1QHZ3_ORYGL
MATLAGWGDCGCHEGEVFVLWAQPDPFPDTISIAAPSHCHAHHQVVRMCFQDFDGKKIGTPLSTGWITSTSRRLGARCATSHPRQGALRHKKMVL